LAVGPHFAGVREVRAQLDEAEPELGVGDVEVVDGDAAVLLHEAVMWSTGAWLALLDRAVVGGQDGLELLSHADGDDAGLGGDLEVGLDHVDLAIAFTETYDWDLTPHGKRGDRLTKGLAHLLQQNW
jgi:hypothetical protein